MPKSSSVEPVCDGLIVRVGESERVHAKALRLARKVVRRNLRGRWKVEPLGPKSRDYAVERRGKRKRLAVSTAWNYVHKLQQDRDVVDAEPSLEIAGLEPELVTAQLTPAEQTVAKSAGGPRHKACSTVHDWSVKQARIDRAWQLTPPSGGKRFGKGIKVGHPDTGYTHHPEIWKNPPGRQRLSSGYDYVADDPYAYDPLPDKGNPGHGTKTSSVIMSDIGSPTAADFVTGAAPEASLVAFRVIRSVVVFKFKNVARAIYKATDAGCHVISMSLGGPIKGRALPRAVEYAVDRGVIVLAAAGNVWPFVVYPAKLDEVIAVAATNCEDRPWSGSAEGKAVDVAAPGESVWTAVTREEDDGSRRYVHQRGHGTSFAVAATAGACALWLAYHGRKKLIDRYGKSGLAAVFKEVLVGQGVRTPAGWQKDRYGAGILDAERLLQAPLPVTAAAKGMKAGPKGPAAPADPVAELCEYFPGQGVAPVRQALAAELKCKESELDALLERLGEEIVFHIATNAAFRQSVQHRLRGLRAKSVRQNRTLGKQASRSLKQALKL